MPKEPVKWFFALLKCAQWSNARDKHDLSTLHFSISFKLSTTLEIKYVNVIKSFKITMFHTFNNITKIQMRLLIYKTFGKVDKYWVLTSEMYDFHFQGHGLYVLVSHKQL